MLGSACVVAVVLLLDQGEKGLLVCSQILKSACYWRSLSLADEHELHFLRHHILTSPEYTDQDKSPIG